MKKILVLGATGLIGVPLSNYLVRQGYNVIRHGNTSSADYQIDLTVPDNFLKILIEIDPDFIINLVALTDVDKCEAEPNLAYLLNIRPVEILQFYYNKKQSVKIIHISTDQVYDGTGPHRESDIKISNIYSLSKYYAEHVALGANGCILRTNFVGRSLISNRTSLSDWIINSLKERRQINLFTDIFFSPLSINTLAKMIELVIKKHTSGVYNLGSREGMSKHNFAVLLAKYLNLNLECAKDSLSEDYKFKAYRPKDMRMNCDLFEKTFGVELPTLSDEIKIIGGDYELYSFN